MQTCRTEGSAVTFQHDSIARHQAQCVHNLEYPSTYKSKVRLHCRKCGADITEAVAAFKAAGNKVHVEKSAATDEPTETKQPTIEGMLE